MPSEHEHVFIINHRVPLNGISAADDYIHSKVICFLFFEWISHYLPFDTSPVCCVFDMLLWCLYRRKMAHSNIATSSFCLLEVDLQSIYNQMILRTQCYCHRPITGKMAAMEGSINVPLGIYRTLEICSEILCIIALQTSFLHFPGKLANELRLPLSKCAKGSSLVFLTNAILLRNLPSWFSASLWRPAIRLERILFFLIAAHHTIS